MPVVAPLRKVPVLGPVLHRVGRSVVPQGTAVLVEIEGGIAKGLVLESDARVAHMLRGGEIEADTQTALTELIRPGHVFYDLGANIGYFSLSVARLVGPDGHVYAFEPDPDNVRQLEANAERNGIGNVTVVRAAAWSSSGTVTFSRADVEETPGRGLGFVDERGGDVASGMTVRAVSLDDFIAQPDHPPPDVIKSDVEGAEVDVFDGAQEVLRAGPSIVCEMHTSEAGRVLGERFEALGYRSRWIDSMHLVSVRADE